MAEDTIQDPSISLFIAVSKFSADVVAQVNSALRAKDIYTQFKSEIMSTAPDFRPYLSTDPQIDYLTVSPIDARDDSRIFFLDQLKSRLQDSPVTGVSHSERYPVQLALISEFVGRWREYIIGCLDRIHLGLCEILNKTVCNHFGDSKVIVETRMIMYEEIELRRAAVLQELESFPKMEQLPFTQNSWQLSSLRQQWLQRYVNARAEHIANPWKCDLSPRPALFDTGRVHMHNFTVSANSAVVTDVLTGLHQLGYENLTLADLARLKPSDAYKEELELAADVRGYFDIAAARVIDIVPMIINHHYLNEFLDTLNFILVKADVHHNTQ
ncbi:hypothetical protein SISNIDRAFT_489116 [Sistotremastrum niveocremeum HHB9708]|uniref:GED domain-containing protein n=1 Tax=Sistotremastrum niveocremeum HHB9708 TaxID=1314777 RepID=A0A164QJ18_9AGAM|nr:hypothetical protein SISNIDRAFT_489116 [Sistotremastrum niveocremeum HHB9708]